MKFSANLGFLWQELPLADAITAAKAAGFDAVECHWPYEQPVADVRQALEQAGLPMLGLNTRRGRPGQNGLAALPASVSEARAAIDEAIDYAEAIGAEAIHVMAGCAEGSRAHDTFLQNLNYACSRTDKMILIEPLNQHDAPGYFLKTTDQAGDIIEELARANLRLMFDCYHVARTEGDVVARLEARLSMIGHIQFASVPDRGPPDHGALHYPSVLDRLSALGWERPLGAEYRPDGPTEATLAWLSASRGSVDR